MTLQEIDYSLFKFINQGMANPILDVVCPLLREKLIWVPVYFFIGYLLLMRFGKNAIVLMSLAGLTILLTDQISASLLKPYFHRLRPCNNPEINSSIRLLVESCGSGFSFVSSHAANHFGLSVFLSFVTVEKKRWVPILLLWAFAISFSQVYVGLHFPADVFAGALLGVLLGSVVGFLGLRLLNQVGLT